MVGEEMIDFAAMIAPYVLLAIMAPMAMMIIIFLWAFLFVVIGFIIKCFRES